MNELLPALAVSVFIDCVFLSDLIVNWVSNRKTGL